MSSSPKYTDYQLSAKAEERLREEKRRRAEARAAERAAAAERSRQERLRRDQHRLAVSVTELLQEVTTFQQSPAGRCVAKSLDQLQADLGRLESMPLPTVEAIGGVHTQLQQLKRELKRVVVQGTAARDAQELEQEAGLLLNWKQQVAADRQASRQFDPDGLDSVEQALRQIDERLTRRDLGVARQMMKELSRRFDQHRNEVETQRSAWLARKHKAQTALDDLQQQLADLQTDETVQRWESQAVTEIEDSIGHVTSIIDNGQFDYAMRETAKLAAKAEQVLRTAERRQAEHEKLEFLAKCTAAALQACGLQVDDPIHLKREGGTDEISIRARRPYDGRALDVLVPQEGAIQWSASGFPMQVVPGTEGQPASVCDEAVKQIQKVQEKLRQLGVQTGAVTWPGQDPDLPIGAAKSTRSKPQHHSHSRVRRARR